MNPTNLAREEAGQPQVPTAVAAARGGPRTAEGKARSRGNALQHGLTARTLLDDALLQHHKESLRAEWYPASPTEEFLVEQLARHAAALDLVERAEPAVLRLGAQGALEMLSGQDLSAGDTDLYLAGAVTSDALERVTRYRRSHEKGFFTALVRLREAKTVEFSIAKQRARSGVFLFESEEGCRSYLVGRIQHKDHRCPHCGHAHGYWLAARWRWQCAGCGRQSGLRTATVMEGSPLPFRCWFAAIHALLTSPDTSAEQLAKATGIRRLATVRRMACTIAAACAGPQASKRLAGLDMLFAQGP